jgi:DNA-binding CsgD family transcriptional regulator
LAATAASDGTIAERAQALLGVLRPLVPFDGAWLALTDPVADSYQSLASVDLDDPTVEFLCGPSRARDIEATGTDPACPPFSPSTVVSSRTRPRPDLPGTVEGITTWAECPMPTGIKEALAVALFAPKGRHVGLLALLSSSQQLPSLAARRRLGRLAPVLAHGIDPMRSLVTAARLVRDATAGVVLHADGGCEPLPGLLGDVLLEAGSPLLAAALDRIDDGQIFSSFLWPRGGRHAPGGHVRVTVLRAPEDVPPGMEAVTLLSPSTDRHGLTPRELDVLGLLVEGCSNQEIARTLVVAPRTVATHLEHVLAKLGAPTRTLAAVHAQRDGLYVPAMTGRRSCITHRECPGTT